MRCKDLCAAGVRVPDNTDLQQQISQPSRLMDKNKRGDGFGSLMRTTRVALYSCYARRVLQHSDDIETCTRTYTTQGISIVFTVMRPRWKTRYSEFVHLEKKIIIIYINLKTTYEMYY